MLLVVGCWFWEVLMLLALLQLLDCLSCEVLTLGLLLLGLALVALLASGSADRSATMRCRAETTTGTHCSEIWRGTAVRNKAPLQRA